MTPVAVAETAFDPSSQRLLFAGQPVLFCTNSPKLAMYAQALLPASENDKPPTTPARASITLHVREMDEPCETFPLFRARGNFARIRFTPGDSFWFNLRTREVFGTCSPEMADDGRRWCVHILPAILGILSATIDVAPIHAACLARKGRGVLLAGHSGAGKSTLTIAMARRGHALLSDDWTYLSEEGEPAGLDVQAWGLPVPVKLLPDASFFFPELNAFRADVSLNGEIAYEVFPEECFGVTRSERCQVSTVVLLERGAEPGCNTFRIRRDEAVAHLQAQVEPLEGRLAGCYSKQLEIIESAVGQASCYRFCFNDQPDKAAEALDKALGR